MDRYDLTEVCKWHPGGELAIMSSVGITDVTPAFYSYHAFCDINSIENLLDKYEYKHAIADWKVPPAPLRPLTFDKQGFYRTVLMRVRALFPGDITKSQRAEVKADKYWWTRFIMCVTSYFIGLYLTACYSRYYSIIVSAAMVLIGFNHWHDLCHNAGPMNGTARELCILLATYTGSLFDTEVWAIHHNIKHHSFTGAHKHDPDDHTWNIAPGFILPILSLPAQCIFYMYFRLSGKSNMWYMNRPAWLKADIGPTTLALLVHVVLMSLLGGVVAITLTLVGYVHNGSNYSISFH